MPEEEHQGSLDHKIYGFQKPEHLGDTFAYEEQQKVPLEEDAFVQIEPSRKSIIYYGSRSM